jgi:hypothetical protein
MQTTRMFVNGGRRMSNARAAQDAPSKYQLEVWSNEPHLSQVYTGLAMLHERRLITLSQRIVSRPRPDENAPHHLRNVRRWHARLETDKRRYYIDVHDSHEIADVDCDVYLKRSYLAAVIPQHMRDKVRPLGLNYEVYKDGFDRFEFRRRLAIDGVRSAALYVAGKLSGSGQPTVSQLSAVPPDGSDPRILFMCGTWDTNEPGRSAEKNAERRVMNDMRAACIAALRTAFGPRFTGGFAHSPHAAENYPQFLLPDARMAMKKNYIEILRQHQICITTTGLHRSNGWKLGEYVAHARAIVSEPLVHAVPDLCANVNYLTFSTPAGCVDAVGRLVDDAELRIRMAKANAIFYQERLRPDKLVERAVREASFDVRETEPVALARTVSSAL